MDTVIYYSIILIKTFGLSFVSNVYVIEKVLNVYVVSKEIIYVRRKF